MGRLPGIISRDEFQRLMARERSRADRNSHVFSLVVFRTSEAPVIDAKRAAQILRDSRRLTDDVGWVNPPDVGVLLPDTTAAGARSYAEKMHATLGDAGCDVADLLYTYQGNTDESTMWAPAKGPGDDGDALGPVQFPNSASLEGTGVAGFQLSDLETAPVGKPTSIVRANDMRDLFLQPLPGWTRAMDLVVSTAMLLALSPVFLTIAIAVRLSSPGPVFFRQLRAGPGGRPFDFYKFRTMVPNAEALKESLRVANEADGPVFKMKDDPRVTRVGRFLRRTSLDELPQLWNVLKGDMSLVGPRPPTMDEIPSYAPWQNRRLELTGGITGIWQTSGRHEIGFTDWMRMDVRYSKHRSLLMDVKLLAKTVVAVVSGRGAS
jgi:lipopolysaccharide/colanic/teichoic acid biosynthesis glycosyltransferase